MGWREVSDRIDGRKVWKETNCTTFRTTWICGGCRRRGRRRRSAERQQRIRLFFSLQLGDSFRFYAVKCSKYPTSALQSTTNTAEVTKKYLNETTTSCSPKPGHEFIRICKMCLKAWIAKMILCLYIHIKVSRCLHGDVSDFVHTLWNLDETRGDVGAKIFCSWICKHDHLILQTHRTKQSTQWLNQSGGYRQLWAWFRCGDATMAAPPEVSLAAVASVLSGAYFTERRERKDTNMFSLFSSLTSVTADSPAGWSDWLKSASDVLILSLSLSDGFV